MSHAGVRTREWVLLGAVTCGALLALWWAVRMPAVCAAATPCAQESRIAPAVIGGIVIALLSAGTAALAHRSRGRVSEGVRGSEGIIAVGVALIAAAAIVFVVLTLFSAGFVL